MVLNRENLNALSRSFRALVLEARESYPKLYPLIADEVESTSRVNYYAWLESIPTVREWVGERQVRNLSAQTFAIENQKFEATVEVLRSDVEDDNIGVYARLFRQLGIKAAAHDDRLVFTLLKEGFTRKAYDGKPFFANDHRIGRNTFSNRGTAPSPGKPSGTPWPRCGALRTLTGSPWASSTVSPSTRWWARPWRPRPRRSWAFPRWPGAGPTRTTTPPRSS